MPKRKEILTPLQARFADEYLVDLNGTQAAERAGYSKSSARSIAAENLTKPDIVRAITAKMELRAEKTGITADRVVLELARVLTADMREYMEWDGDGKVTLTPSLDLTRDQSAEIAEVTVTPTKEGNQVKLKMHGKLEAARLLAAHLGMVTDRPDNTLNVVNWSDLVRVAMEHGR